MPTWTKMQQAAISSRRANVLVSAAAGSGKTAVLTERVIQRIIGDEENEPIEIDKFLIVTFTSAAAEEMKERIMHKLSHIMDELSESDTPDVERLDYLERQLSLIPKASISTIHAFCLKTIRAYFNYLEIDPNIKVGNEAELSIMKNDILNELIEEHLEAEDVNFLKLAEVYGDIQGVENLKSMILQLYTFSKSTLFPERWLQEQVNKLQVCYQSINEMPWSEVLKAQIIAEITDIKGIVEQALSICHYNSGPEGYTETIEKDKYQLEAVDLEMDLESIIYAILKIEFGALSRKKQECDLELKERVKSYRDLVKKLVKKLQDNLCFIQDKVLLKQLPEVGSLMQALIDIIDAFDKRYTEKKREATLVDYNDLEHLCLKLLIRPKEDEQNRLIGVEYTEIAEELSCFYKEIYMDEYQDSNTVQETLLKAISEATKEGPTRFMVGDMKQSIYRFRLANPELFAAKYRTYQKYEEKTNDTLKNVCIDLSQNFRSRENILDGINDIFSQVMSLQVGDLVYDEYAQLKVGNLYDKGDREGLEEEAISNEIELHLLETKEKEVEEDTEALDIKDTEYEALMVAQMIDELLKGKRNPTHIYDAEIDAYRRVEAKDIVILLRSVSAKASIYENALINKGIGAYSEKATSFFDAVEVQTMISLLKIIDNPMQDIPLMTVLRSPIMGLTFDELVYIRKSKEKVCFYDAIQAFIEQVSENEEIEALRNKLIQILPLFKEYRRQSSLISVDELITKLYVDTGYYQYISILSTGVKKKANLDLLKKYAREYETTYHGKLFGFIQYLDQLSQTKEGIREAKLVGGNEDVVRIMSIHKSKGLEFPVVFLCDAGKKFNEADLKEHILLHHELGIAPNYIDVKNYIKYPTLAKLAIKEQIKRENISEEMRVLYVALTRAKEKLFITGTVPSVETKVKEWQLFAHREEEAILPLGIRIKPTYLNWIGLALYAHEKVPYFRNQLGDNVSYSYKGRSKWHVQVWDKQELTSIESTEGETAELKRLEIQNWDTHKQYSEYKEKIETQLTYEYPYMKSLELPTKVSVSEIKKRNQAQVFAESVSLLKGIEEDVVPSYVPSFMEKAKINEGAHRGTLIHSVLEKLDYLKYQTKGEIQEEIQTLVLNQVLDKEVLEVVNYNQLEKMAQSPIIQKMREANYIQKEKNFMYLAPAPLVSKDYPENEEILIQGIVDAFFIDEEGITIIDYKTDYINREDIEESKEKIVKKYRKQLEIYVIALEKITKISVAHCYIYLYNINEWVQV